MGKLSKRFIDGLAPRPSDYFEWCEELRGFGIRIWPSGGKTYVAQYRSAGRTRRFKIGNHGRLTVEEARKEARIVLGDVARGKDPSQDRATRRASLTVTDLCDRYFQAADKGLIAGKGGRSKKASTLATDRGRAERHIKPLLGRKLVIDLTQADLNRFVRDVTTGKTACVEKTGKLRGKAVVDGGAGTAARTMGLLGGLLSFAVAEGIRPDNPARGVKRPADKSRTRRLTPDEYAALGRAMAQAERDGERWQAIVGARLLALTGMRLGEATGLRWAEVDLTGQALRLEDSKEGRSVRPIGRAVVDLIASLPRDGTFVLPAARGEGSFGGMSGAIERFATRAGLSGVTAHTLRHSFASTAGDLGYSEATIGAMLGHAGTTVTSRYVHHLDAVLIAAADKIAVEICTMMHTHLD